MINRGWRRRQLKNAFPYHLTWPPKFNSFRARNGAFLPPELRPPNELSKSGLIFKRSQWRLADACCSVGERHLAKVHSASVLPKNQLVIEVWISRSVFIGVYWWLIPLCCLSTA